MSFWHNFHMILHGFCVEEDKKHIKTKTNIHFYIRSSPLTQQNIENSLEIGLPMAGPMVVPCWEEHIRAICSKQGDDVQAAFCEMADALDAICSSLKKNGDCPNGFARSETFGFLFDGILCRGEYG